MKLIALLILFYVRIASATDLVLAPGHSADLPAPRGVTISVSDGSVVKVSDLGAKVKITGHKRGSASVRVGSDALNVYVVTNETAELWSRLLKALEGKRGLKLVARPAKSEPEIAIQGHLLRWQDWQALADAAGETGAHYSFEAEISPELQTKAHDIFTARLRADHLPELAYAFAPAAHVTLPTDSAELQTHVARALGIYGLVVNTSPDALDLKPMVRVKLIVAEFYKNFERQFGLKWPDLKAQLWPTLKVPFGDGVVDVDAIESAGAGHILASPTLLCRSGKEAHFLAGGEIPVKMSSFTEQNVDWKEYGVRLTIKPKADYSGRMSIEIQTEVSEPDFGNKVDGIPPMHTNRVETFFDLSKPRTIVLSGLIKKNQGDNHEGLPWLSGLPVIGPLFGSKHFQNNESELAIFVTPEVVSASEASL